MLQTKTLACFDFVAHYKLQACIHTCQDELEKNICLVFIAKEFMCKMEKKHEHESWTSCWI